MLNSYENVMPVDKESADKMFLSKDFELICHALVSVVFHEKDWKWVQDKCISFLMNDNPDISGLAATCLGHVARLHRQIEKERVIILLRSRQNNVKIAGRIEDAINDIEMYAVD